MNILKIVRSWVVFSRKEANGFLIIVLLVVVYISTPWLFKKYSLSDNVSEKDSLMLQAWIMELEHKQDQRQEKVVGNSDSVVFYFDPNTASQVDLLKAGIPDWLSERIINYRRKGGVFHKKNELLKIYGFSDHLYSKVSSYVIINGPHVNKRLPVEEKAPLYDINLVTAQQLQKVKGIGPVLSERIIKFRDKLGGFISKDQLKEVYGLDSLVVKELLKGIFISNGYSPQKININTADEKSLGGHPYISSYQAKGIIFKREKLHIRDIQHLKELKIFKEEELIKVAPYLAY